MIDYIKGRLAEKGPGWMVVENNSVGFRVNVPLSTERQGWQEGEDVQVFTRLIIKEDGLYLYGFAGAEERNLFNIITGVSGFGPRLALSILGIVSVSQFYISILDEDINTLCSIPGIGRKSAQRLILELKEKLPAVFPADGKIAVTPGITAPASGPEEEALKALLSLGYSRTESVAVIDEVFTGEKEVSPEELVKAALRKLS